MHFTQICIQFALKITSSQFEDQFKARKSSLAIAITINVVNITKKLSIQIWQIV